MADSPQPLVQRCPACGGATFIERVRCHACGTAVEGKFTQGWVEALSREQLAFVKVFLSCRGKIKDVEQALGISYPTVVSRLDDIVAAISSSAAPGNARAEQRRKILEDLQTGTIDAAEAARRLREG